MEKKNFEVGSEVKVRMNTISGVKELEYVICGIEGNKAKVKPNGQKKWTGSWIEFKN